MTFEQIRQYIKGVINGIDFNNHISPMPAEDMSEIVSPLPSVMSRRFKYSTEEQIVGEWIDGKPIYRKVMTNLSTGSGFYNQAGLVDEHIGDVISAVGIMKGSSTNISISGNLYGDSSLSQYLTLWIDSGYVYCCADGLHKDKPWTLIIEYTKTTD